MYTCIQLLIIAMQLALGPALVTLPSPQVVGYKFATGWLVVAVLGKFKCFNCTPCAFKP